MARIQIRDLPRPSIDEKAARSLRGGTLMSPLALLGASRRPSLGHQMMRVRASILRFALR